MSSYHTEFQEGDVILENLVIPFSSQNCFYKTHFFNKLEAKSDLLKQFCNEKGTTRQGRYNRYMLVEQSITFWRSWYPASQFFEIKDDGARVMARDLHDITTCVLKLYQKEKRTEIKHQDYVLASEKKTHPQPPRLNLSFALSDVKLPGAANIYRRRDRNRIQSILQSGLMPMVNWKQVQMELTFELGRLLHCKIQAHFDFVDSSCTTQHQVVDIDSLLLKEQADIYVLHDKCMVYLVTFSSDVCSHIHSMAAKTTNISVKLNEEIIEGIKAVGNSDSMQKSEEAVYTANYGATVRPQRSTLNTKSEKSREINQAVGCPRGGTITNSAPFPFSTSTPVCELYRSEFLPVYCLPGLDESDRWYSERPNKKRSRVPRFTPGNCLEQRQKFKSPSPLVSSMPPSADKKLVAAAKFESGARTISEWILCNVFYSLPYGTAGSLARDQLKAASDYAISRSLPLPCQSLCRPLPKGAIGIQRTKALHDDGNSALIPGIWTSLLGDEAVVLRFIGRRFHVYFRTTTFRFCWFMGWIPHKTEVLEKPTIRSEGTMSNVERIHHSAFSKTEIEHLALSSMHPTCMHVSVDSYSHN
jgi:hypothetical protein